MKGELQALGEEVDDNVVSASKMQTQILNLTKGKVNIFENDGKNFRNIYDIFKDIAEILPTLSGADQSALLETIAGKNRSNAILAMLNNWSEVERALAAANDAQGTAQKENAVFMDSIEGRMNRLKASWSDLSNDVVNSELIKLGTSGLSGLVGAIDSVVERAGALPVLLGGAATLKSIMSIS